MKIKKEYVILTCILVIAVVARVLKFGEPVVGTDVAAFCRLGKNLIENGSYTFGENYNYGVFFPPGYSIFVGILNLFIGDMFYSAKLVSIISSCITILISYSIGKELYNEDTGLFAALCFAIYPLVLIVSLQGWSDSLFFCFLLLSIYLFVVSIRKDNFFMHVLLGVSAAMAYLTRPEGMFLLLLPILHLFGLFDGRTRFSKKYLLKTAVLFAAFILLISPYVLFLKNYTGRIELSGKNNISILLGELEGDDYQKIVDAPDNLYDKAAFTLSGDKTQLVGWNRKTNRSLMEYIFKDPDKLFMKYLKNSIKQIRVLTKLLLPIIIPLFFFLMMRDRFRNKINLIFILFPVVYFFMYPLFIIIEKQTLLIVLFLIFPSSIGFVNSQSGVSDLAGYFGLNRNKIISLLQKNIKFAIIIILASGSITYLKYSSFDKGPAPSEHKRAGDYLKKYVSSEYEKINVMSAKPLVSFYGDAKYTMLPYAGVSDVINFAKLYNVDIIAIDERLLSKWDHYNELVQMHRLSGDVELIYEDNSEELIKLFRVIK
jgi:4-amino-4-deoxy-L-arabinose transferase-like glycosyltransferase